MTAVCDACALYLPQCACAVQAEADAEDAAETAELRARAERAERERDETALVLLQTVVRADSTERYAARWKALAKSLRPWVLWLESCVADYGARTRAVEQERDELRARLAATESDLAIARGATAEWMARARKAEG